MTEVGIKIYFLFERRKSSAHKWILMHGFNGIVPKTMEDVCRICFTPSTWSTNPPDLQGMHLLASLISFEKTKCDELPFAVYLDEFRVKNPNLCGVRVNDKHVGNFAEKTAALLTDFTSKKTTVSKSMLTLHELFQFVDNLEYHPEEKRNHTIFRLIFQHMQLKLCCLKYPEVRVHFITTFEVLPTIGKILQSVIAAEEIVNIEDVEEVDDEEQQEQAKIDDTVSTATDEIVYEKEQKEIPNELAAEIDRRMEKAIQEEEKRLADVKRAKEEAEKENKQREEQREREKIQEQIELLAQEQKKRENIEQERIRELKKWEEEEKQHLQRLAEEEERCKRLAEERKQQLKIEQEKRRQQIAEQEVRERKRLKEMEEERQRQEKQRFEEQKRHERELRQLQEQRLAQKQKRDNANERERQKAEAEKREKERLEREAQLQKDNRKNNRQELSIADVYDFSGDGWDIENVDFTEKMPPTEIYCPEPSFDNIYLIPKDQSIETIPKSFSLLPKNAVLAISEVKEETRNITRWLLRKLCAIYPENKYSLCFISQNFSESDCSNVQQFVEQKQMKNEWVVIGVECEFSPVDPLSRECSTLLNEFDARTSLLILELISMSNTTVVFETTKPFNHVWCWKYNLINTPTSQWFAKATGNPRDMNMQRQAHSSAMIRLVTSASNQAAAIVRCTNQSAMQKETYFDMVILGCNANCNETQILFDFINEQCLQKLQNQRWKKRIAQLEFGDALAIPISRRFNDNQYDLCCIEETEKQIAIVGASGGLLGSQKPVFRNNIPTPFMQTIPMPSSYAFTANGISVDYQFGDPHILKNINPK